MLGQVLLLTMLAGTAVDSDVQAPTPALYVRTDDGVREIRLPSMPVRSDDGRVLWTPAQVRAVAAVLDADYLPSLLSARSRVPMLRDVEACFTLALPTGDLHLTLPGPIEAAGGKIIWTEDQLRTIAAKLAEDGQEDALASFFGLSAPGGTPSSPDPEFGDGPTPMQGDPTTSQTGEGGGLDPLNPSPGECLNGVDCTNLDGVRDCCKGSPDLCMKCAPSRTRASQTSSD